MYKLEIKPAPAYEASTDEYSFVVNDLIVSISDRLNIDEEMISKDLNSIVFNCDISEKEIKEKLKEVFIHHFDCIRFVNITKF